MRVAFVNRSGRMVPFVSANIVDCLDEIPQLFGIELLAEIEVIDPVHEFAQVGEPFEVNFKLRAGRAVVILQRQIALLKRPMAPGVAVTRL